MVADEKPAFSAFLLGARDAVVLGQCRGSGYQGTGELGAAPTISALHVRLQRNLYSFAAPCREEAWTM